MHLKDNKMNSTLIGDRMRSIAKLRKAFCLGAVLGFSILVFSSVAAAQNENIAEIRAKAVALTAALKYTEALPLWEKVVKANPNDAEAHFYLGFSLLGQAKNVDDTAARKDLRIRARNAFLKSKELGNNSELVKGLIEGLPADGSGADDFTENSEANKLMAKGEAFFSSGKLNEALAAYQAALKLDPKLYHAALFSGDVYFQLGKFDEAEIWYQKAIAIDPFTESAYRYSATPLMKQGKTDQARDRYVEAYIVEPNNRLAASGLIQWGQVTNTRLRHPKFDIPEFTVGADGKTNSKITVSPATDDDSMALISYTTTRSEWYEKKFAQKFPNEKAYRHTLQEEAEALRNVVSMAKNLKARKKNEQIATLAKLDQEGLLEAYVLLAIADRGISQDYAAYLRQDRDKLRQYVLKYVIGGGN